MGIPWSVLGRIAVRSLPTVISAVEVFNDRKPGPEKLAEVVTAIKNELINLSSPHGQIIADNPKVTEALEEATSALVKVQNIIAEAELDAIESNRRQHGSSSR